MIVNKLISGSYIGVQIVYTQTFAAVPDQWPGPQPGTIGLGTITGEIGIPNTNDETGEQKMKRTVDAQMLMPLPKTTPTPTRVGAAIVDATVRPDLDVEAPSGDNSDDFLLDPSTLSLKARPAPPDAANASSQLSNDASLSKTKARVRVSASAGSVLALVLAIAAMVVA